MSLSNGEPERGIGHLAVLCRAVRMLLQCCSDAPSFPCCVVLLCLLIAILPSRRCLSRQVSTVTAIAMYGSLKGVRLWLTMYCRLYVHVAVHHCRLYVHVVVHHCRQHLCACCRPRLSTAHGLGVEYCTVYVQVPYSKYYTVSTVLYRKHCTIP